MSNIDGFQKLRVILIAILTNLNYFFVTFLRFSWLHTMIQWKFRLFLILLLSSFQMRLTTKCVIHLSHVCTNYVHFWWAVLSAHSCLHFARYAFHLSSCYNPRHFRIFIAFICNFIMVPCILKLPAHRGNTRLL